MSNKDMVRTAMTRLFVDRDLSALETYWDAGYIQHNPRMPSGLDFFRKIIPTLKPDFLYEPGLVIADGDFVMIHGRYVGWTDTPLVGIDIFRVKNGKFIEHWDVIQEEVPASQTAAGNSMFPIEDRH